MIVLTYSNPFFPVFTWLIQNVSLKWLKFEHIATKKEKRGVYLSTASFCILSAHISLLNTLRLWQQKTHI